MNNVPLSKRMLWHFLTFFAWGQFKLLPSPYSYIIVLLGVLFIIYWEIFHDPKCWCHAKHLFEMKCRFIEYEWQRDSARWCIDMQTKGFMDIQTKLLGLIAGYTVASWWMH